MTQATKVDAAVTSSFQAATIERAPLSHSTYPARLGESILLAILAGTTLAAICMTWRWPLVLDGPVFQYGAFLLDHGKVPYRDIIDQNSLGVYFSSWIEIHLFGYSDLGWRLYDLLFILLGTIGITFICKPIGKSATIVGSCLLVLMHIKPGPGEIGERDFQVAVLELVSVGFMLQGFRDGKRGWFFASGMIGCLGATIKPTGALFLAAFVVQATVLGFRREEGKRFSPAMWIILGAILPCAMAFAYLVWKGAWLPFLQVWTTLIPLYARIRPRPWSFLRFILNASLEPLRLLVLPSGLLLLHGLEDRIKREAVSVLLGLVCGFAGFCIQRKGFPDHLDPLVAFLGVWCGLSIAMLIKDHRMLIRLPLHIALTFWVLTWIPRFIQIPAGYSRGLKDSNEIKTVHVLEGQIASLRASGKDHGIQIMDMNAGAAHALYDLKLVQSTGFLQDIFFFNPPGHPFVLSLRAQFLREMDETKPDILVVAGKPWPDPKVGYTRLDQWPELKKLVQTNYQLNEESHEFRIYVRR